MRTMVAAVTLGPDVNTVNALAAAAVSPTMPVAPQVHGRVHLGGGRAGGFLAAATLVMAALVAACGAGAQPSATAVPPSTTAPTTAPPATASPPATTPPTTFPPSQADIAPGTYTWVGFDPAISVTLGSGWALGHDNPSFFDLFRGSDFPAVTFARFTDVAAAGPARVPASDASAVEAAFTGRPDVAMTNIAPVELAGLTGRQFDLTTLAPRTPLFWGPAGIFQLDPEFMTRYRVLDVPGGGVLVIGIHARAGSFDAALDLGEPVVASLVVEGP